MTEAAAPAQPAASRVQRRGWLVGAGFTVIVLQLLPLFVWWWVSTAGSLRQGLQLARWLLPEDQVLEFDDAAGSIRHGGRIGVLHWRMPGTNLRVEALQLDWSLEQLFDHALDIGTLRAGSVQLRLEPQARAPQGDTAPFEMPADVTLPITLTLPLHIDTLLIDSVAGEPRSPLVIEDIDLNYNFDGAMHRLAIDSLRYGQSSATGSAQLDAATLALQVQLDAALRDLVPDTPFAMQLGFTARGGLGDDSAIEAALDGSEINANGDGAQVHAQATLRPFATQPAERIELQLQGFNLHAFHAAAPATDLAGTATLLPEGNGLDSWRFQLQLDNHLPGAWDQERLPVQSAVANGALTLDAAQIDAADVALVGRAPAGQVTLQGQVPLRQPLDATLRLQLQQVDLQPLLAGLPTTALGGEVELDSGNLEAAVQNGAPGPLDRERLPLETLRAAVQITAEEWRASDVSLGVGDGVVRLQGSYLPATQALDLNGSVQQLPVGRIHSRLAEGLTTQLDGSWRARGNPARAIDFNVDISGSAGGGEMPAELQRGPWEIRALQGRGRWSPTRLAIADIHLDAFEARIDGSDLQLALPGMQNFKATITASAPGLSLTADAAMPAESAAGHVALQVESAARTLDWLRGLPWIGERVPIEEATGAASLDASWQGNWQDWLDGIAHPAAHPDLHLDATASARDFHIDFTSPEAGKREPFAIPQLALQVTGNLASASASVQGEAEARGLSGSLDMAAQMTRGADDGREPLWNFAIARLAAAATLPDQTSPWQLQVSDGLEIALRNGGELEIRTSAGSASVRAPGNFAANDTPLELDWQPLVWLQGAAGTRLTSSGHARGIQPAWVDVLSGKTGEGPLAAAGIASDLQLRGEWNLDMNEELDIRAHLQRDSGDLQLRGTPAGIRTLEFDAGSAGDNVSLSVNWDSERAGVIKADLRTQLQAGAGWSLPDNAPLDGHVSAQLQDLGAWGFITPPGWRVQGALDADVTVAGTVRQPQLRGAVTGEKLNVRSVLDGVDLHDGSLRATLAGNRLDIEALEFEGGTGSRAYISGQSGNRTQPPRRRGKMTASGSIDWSGVATAPAGESGIDMDVTAKLDRMQVLVRNDRQLTLSGELSAALDAGKLSVSGDLTVDRAAILLPEAGAATLGDDVRVVRAGDGTKPEPRVRMQTSRPMDLEIRLALGRDLALEGEGITTRLEGNLTVRNATSGNDPFSVVGLIRTDQGRYRAWGQALDVETGEMLFNGPYGNPSLNLLAIRPDIEVRAGVRVTGTLLAPQLRLFSEPELPEAEKLSWVVLGRAPTATSSDGDSMQQAALGLLAGQLGSPLASGLGLDEVGLSEDGVSVGKRIGDELYVTYVQGLAGAASTLYIFYDITRRLTVRAETGETSAVDLIYTIRFD